jgi:hypothetical protein
VVDAVIVVTSDQHAGSTVAACPPDPIPADDGGAYMPSRAQVWLYERWRLFWDEAARVRDELKPHLYGTLFNGDMLEGSHHGTTQILSGNPEAQAKVLSAVMDVPLSQEPDAIWVVRGTAAHNGNSNSGEEGTARRWRDIGLPVHGDPDTHTASWWHLRAEIGGVLIDATHHGRTGHREHTRANAANLHAFDILMSHVKSGDRHPDLCLRAHFHRFNDSYDACPVRVVTTGAWQLKTEYVHKKHADSLADIGGAIVIIRDGGYEVRKIRYQAARGAIWTPVG